MVYVVLTLLLLFAGRKIGWVISKYMYTANKGVVVLFGLAWGAAIALSVRFLIDQNQPGIVMRWLMGYALGAYVAIPNYGLLDESTIPAERLPHHVLLKGIPWLWYIVLSAIMAFRGQLFTSI